MGDLREPDGGLTVQAVYPASASGAAAASLSASSSSSPTLEEIGPERLAAAEKAGQKIISEVHPNAVSEERRRDVIDYVQRLIKGRLNCEVFPYGSVPLKTYLPDGDIDLTAFGGANAEDALAGEMVSVLEGEDQNRSAEFIVKDVQLIRAEVKLVKCIVQNIVVDISFNQIGGLCTLCFLEQVDRLIGKDHLFKRSIILIKAWCYYESRILGAHHGLISTYALETLVLYIFHLFHLKLNGPLVVLYKFLDYFSKFEWDKYCISLSGPVCISSLPDFRAEMPENDGGDLLLSSDFLRHCVDKFSVPSKGADTNSRTFPQKYMNIVDPLKENNNLGRSVSKGNYYRIRSAFTYGARKLGQILLQPEDTIAVELHKFFSNTLDRHGSGQRPDVQDPATISCYNGFDSEIQISGAEFCQEDKEIFKSKSARYIGTTGNLIDHDSSPQDRLDHPDGQQSSSVKAFCTSMSEADSPNKKSAAFRCHLSGGPKDLDTFGIESLKISNNSAKNSPQNGEESISPMGMAPHAPHLYFSNSIPGNGKMGDVNTESKSKHLETYKTFDPGNGDWSSTSSSMSAGSSHSLSDLSGDFDNNFNCLQYGWWCYEYASSLPSLPIHPPMPSHIHSKNSWDGIQRPSQFKHNGFSNGNANGFIPGPAFYPINQFLIPGIAFGLEELPKPRGTGTYFPNMTRPPSGYRPSVVNGRNLAASRSPRHNGRAMTYADANILERSSHEPSQSQLPVGQVGKAGSSDIHQPNSPCGNVQSCANGAVIPSRKVLESGSVVHGSVPASLHESSRLTRTDSSNPRTSNQGLLTPGMQRSKPLLGKGQDRVTVQSSYHLKDEDDFPPLSN